MKADPDYVKRLEKLSKKDKYSVFLGGNQSITDIKTDVKNGKTLMLIKDSYSHCMLPLLMEEAVDFAPGDHIFIPGVRRAIEEKAAAITAYLVAAGKPVRALQLGLAELTDDERRIILAGCLINFYAK